MPDGKTPGFLTTEATVKTEDLSFSLRRPTHDAEDKTVTGWDPYEVWRTRVLLPRLKEQNAARED